MDADLSNRLDYELELLMKYRSEYMRRLRECNGAEHIRLRTTKRANGRKYYYAKHKGSDQYVYIGGKGSTEDNIYINSICDAHFLHEALKRIDKDIKLIKSLKDGFQSYDQYTVNSKLSEIYRRDITPASKAYEEIGAKWKIEQLAFQSRFPENFPQHKSERTSDGVMVKTISEVVLYERIKDAGLYAIYELPLIMNDYGPPMYPDLTVLSPIDMKTEIIIEYVGRLDLPKYREDFARRLWRYISNGYIPGVNLFFVYGDKDGHIDSMQISRVITDICGLLHEKSSSEVHSYLS